MLVIVFEQSLYVLVHLVLKRGYVVCEKLREIIQREIEELLIANVSPIVFGSLLKRSDDLLIDCFHFLKPSALLRARLRISSSFFLRSAVTICWNSPVCSMPSDSCQLSMYWSHSFTRGASPSMSAFR